MHFSIMGSKKRDLEIVYNLLWKHRPLSADDRSNIVGMYDIPSTTMNWETFKSYLLKNSGSLSADVKVSYIDSDDKEVAIESQSDFQLALYSFRKRARVGEIITLKLDKVRVYKNVEQKKSHCSDTQVQTVCAEEPALNLATETPPDWFLKYMKKFKKELMEELSGSITKINSKSTSTSSYYPRKSKIESSKRNRKIPVRTSELDSFYNDDVRKTLKVDIKHETKQDKRERKEIYKQCPRKMLKRIIPVENERYYNRSFWPNLSDIESLMDATDVSTHETTIPHMIGGETFMQQWHVLNSGKLAWSSDTQLRFAWGSESLIPIEKKIPCPPLQPGEKGLVSVYLQVPNTPGNYECYWHFHHFGRRFGRWLGCEVIVDPSKREIINLTEKEEIIAVDLTPTVESNNCTVNMKLDVVSNAKPSAVEKSEMSKIEPQAVENNNVAAILNDFNSSDTDNISILSLPGSNSPSFASNFDYVFVASEEQDLTDTTVAIADQSNATTGMSEMLQTTSQTIKKAEISNETTKQDRQINVSENKEADYAYIYYNGEKYTFHKRFLSDEYFNTAEKTYAPEEPVSSSSSLEKRSRLSSAMSQSSSNRLFVFPQRSPGFEVVYPDGENHSMNTAEKYLTDGYISDMYLSVGTNNTNEYEEDVDLANVPLDACRCESVSSICNNASSQIEPTNQTDQQNPNIEPNETISVKEECSEQSHSQTPNQGMESCGSRVDSSSASNSNVCKDTSNEKVDHTKRESTYTNAQSPQGINRERYHIHRPNCSPGSENLFTGAAILASSAMSTARNVMNMVIQTGEGKWVNGHWVADNPHSKRESELRLLAEMGFLNRDLNATLMARYKDDVHRVISELVQ